MSARSGRTVVYLLSMLTKCKGLCSAQLRTLLLDASKAAFAGISMLLRTHFNIVLGIASKFVVNEEGAVASIENVNLGIGKFWVLVGIASPVLVT